MRRPVSTEAPPAVLYAVTAAFGALSLLTMTGRGQIMGMVVIASSIVTWIGVRQLGYAEFAEIQRSLRYGLTNERRSVGDNVYLASLRERFAQAADLPQLRSALAAAMTRLQSRRAEGVFEDGPAPAVVAASFPAWESEEAGSVIEPMATWSVPIHFDGRATKGGVDTRPHPAVPVRPRLSVGRHPEGPWPAALLAGLRALFGARSQPLHHGTGAIRAGLIPRPARRPSWYPSDCISIAPGFRRNEWTGSAAWRNVTAAGVHGYRRAQCLRLEEGECLTQSR
jgi:hypothetical protein